MSFPLPNSGKPHGGWSGQSYYLVVQPGTAGLSGSGEQEISFPIELPSGTIGTASDTGDSGGGWVYMGAYARVVTAPSGSGIGSVTASLGFSDAPQTMLLNHIMQSTTATGSLWTKLSGTGSLPVGTFEAGHAPIVTLRAGNGVGGDAWANDISQCEVHFRIDVIPVYRDR